ncbi:MAG: UDP-N-acetylmuramate dehydrogenase [Candidatus Faecousia sp.]|nr:UDP-N-acetylmuramate dehydrogenase [Clostridiales bacterium]MDY6180474.1 UDP-N-acetylmuramate dehydrogenase [Candidatus Faecousia sp.]
MTDFTDFQQKLSAFLPDLKVCFGEPMAKHTSFRIGGAAEVMAFPKSAEELAQLLKVSGLLDTKPAILGAGTNVLAPDEGLRGLTICLKDALDGMECLDDTHIRVMAGVTMTRAAMFAAGLGLSGLEFAHGIPGSVGGGVYMNAGAYGGEICQVCEQVEVMDFQGKLSVWDNAQMGFSYRHSRLQEREAIVVSALFRLEQKDPQQIRDKMKELMAKRSASQPLDLPSAGSAFKRPQGGYAAALIDQAGLRGYQVGGAAISQKHTGFAVNLGGATAKDVRQLLDEVSEIVYEKSGIRLEPEIRIW